MIFDKASTRTRLSFEAGMHQLGGIAIYLNTKDTQLGRGEPVADSAKVISRMADAVMIRTFEQKTIEEFALNSRVPVINGLTNQHHPCQILADIYTYQEQTGQSIAGKTVAWIGDGNNMCESWIQAASILNFYLNIATPSGYQPETIIEEHHSWVTIFSNPQDAVKNADIVTTDVWTSMGFEAENQARLHAFKDWQVTDELMSLAKPNVLFMHCLPAHRGEEVSASVIDGPQSVVWEEAANRLHVQKALLEFLIRGEIVSE
jgi:ornithine carbamoyltransferase